MSQSYVKKLSNLRMYRQLNAPHFRRDTNIRTHQNDPKFCQKPFKCVSDIEGFLKEIQFGSRWLENTQIFEMNYMFMGC